jgi:hypothetical protein
MHACRQALARHFGSSARIRSSRAAITPVEPNDPNVVKPVAGPMHRQLVKAIARQEEVDAGRELINERLAFEEYLEDDVC